MWFFIPQSAIRIPKFALLLLFFLILSHCSRQAEPLALFQYQEPTGVSSVATPAFTRLELPQGRYYENQFALRLGTIEVPCVAQIISTYLDRSVHMIHLTWVAQNLQAFETRTYALCGEYLEFPDALHLVSDEPQIEVNNGVFTLKINENGLNQLDYDAENYLFRQTSELINHSAIIDSIENQPGSQLKISENNPFYCSIIRTVHQSFYKYSIQYTIFRGFPCILNTIQITPLKNIKLNLIEPFVIEKPQLMPILAIICGKNHQQVTIEDGDDYYDYLISTTPKSRLFLHYKDNRLRKLRYNYIEEQEPIASVENAVCLSAEIDSSLWMTCLTPEKAWKKHSAYHCRLKHGSFHLSWHRHGFQEAGQRYRFYQERDAVNWKKERTQTFRNLIVFHPKPSGFPEFQNDFRRYQHLLRFN